VGYLEFDGLRAFFGDGKLENDLPQLSIFSHIFISLACNLKLANATIDLRDETI
jgi:hypothetical protein